MNVESVAYVYSDAELGNLLSLLELPGIPFCDLLSASSEDGLSSLEKDAVITRTPDGVLMNKIAVFLVISACDCTRFICLRSPSAYTALFLSPSVHLVFQRNNGRCVFWPFPHYAEAEAHLLSCLSSHTGESSAFIQNTQGHWQCDCLPRPLWSQTLSQAASWALFNETPSGKDASLWKP